MKTKQKIEIGTTFPWWWVDRFVNAEVVDRRRNGRKWLWKIRLTESQQPVRRTVAETIVEFEYGTKWLTVTLDHLDGLPTFAPARPGSAVVRWINFGSHVTVGGLWCEVREQVVCGGSRPTHWQRCEYGSVEALLASGDAVPVQS